MYTQEDFDFDNQQVIVQKIAPDLDEPESETLQAQGESGIPQPTDATETTSFEATDS